MVLILLWPSRLDTTANGTPGHAAGWPGCACTVKHVADDNPVAINCPLWIEGAAAGIHGGMSGSPSPVIDLPFIAQAAPPMRIIPIPPIMPPWSAISWRAAALRSSIDGRLRLG